MKKGFHEPPCPRHPDTAHAAAARMSEALLVINSGSSSVKFAAYDITPGGALLRIAHGKIDGIGNSPRLLVWGSAGTALTSLSFPSARM